MSIPLSHAESDDLVVASGVVDAVSRHYPELLPGFDAALAVAGAMALAERTKPLSLVFEGGSGNGKTEIIHAFFPLPDSDMDDYVYRSDRFTPKSFVTHASTVKKGELRKMDLLPKLENKILLTKELSPIFRGREQEMADSFGILITVLDGLGFICDSGTRGRRGYEANILFNWLAATTPLPASTHRLMSQLGTRLLFYEVPAVKADKKRLLRYALKTGGSGNQNEVREKVNNLVSAFLTNYPVGSISPSTIVFSEVHAAELVQWAKLLVAGRAAVNYEKVGYNWTPVAAMPPEGVWKVISYLKELTFGHALIHGREYINESDLVLVQEVAVSSIPGHLRRPLRRLGRYGSINTSTAVRLCRVSAPTARNYLDELALLGIGALRKGRPASNQPDEVVLSEEYQWLRTSLTAPIHASDLEI